MEPLLLIKNAGAGGDDDHRLEAALRVLREVTDVEVAETADPGELDSVLHRRGGRHIVVAGGDGSLHAMVAALYRRHELADAVVGLIPTGTGNDFARGAGIPLEPKRAARVIVDSEPSPVDLMVDCLGGVVVNNVHIGVGAEASRNAQSWKRFLGRLGYLVGALKASVRPPFMRLRIVADDEEVANFAQPILMVALGNAPRVGGGAAVTPEADPTDGRMDVMISFAVGPIARFGYVLQLRRGEHHAREDVAYLRARAVSVSGQGFYCSADGELYGPERNRTWHVEKAAFSMPLPDQPLAPGTPDAGHPG